MSNRLKFKSLFVILFCHFAVREVTVWFVNKRFIWFVWISSTIQIIQEKKWMNHSQIWLIQCLSSTQWFSCSRRTLHKKNPWIFANSNHMTMKSFKYSTFLEFLLYYWSLKSPVLVYCHYLKKISHQFSSSSKKLKSKRFAMTWGWTKEF